ncbi:MAG TPA: hypothetical protein VIF15_15510 [Polyangiaceae bacterium]|jgi:hypothetical protein
MRTLVLVIGVTSWAGCAVALGACGSGDTGGGPGSDGGSEAGVDATADGTTEGAAADTGADATGTPEGSVDDGGAGAAFCVATYGALRTAFDGCCTAADKTTQPYQLIDGFLQLAIQTCEKQMSSAIARGRVTFDFNAAQSCEGALQGFIAGGVCWNAIDTNQSGKGIFSSSPCNTVVTGRQGQGQPCAVDFECQDSLTCVGWTNASDGLCETPGAAGAACGAAPDAGTTITIDYGFGAHPACATGAFCAGLSCAAQRAGGAACAVDAECLSGTCRVGQCGTGAPSAQNGPCADKHDCQNGLYCAPGDGGTTPGTCQPREAASGACTASGNQCKGTCVVPDGGSAGTCAAICGSG